MAIDVAAMEAFREVVWGHYREHGRELPWREEPYDPYRILVSEVMLQQTQVPRVIPKYHQFLITFPTIQSLAEAELGDVLKQWNGLGYNRRAKYLHEASKQLVFVREQWSLDDLTACKGIGPNTAAAVVTYAYDKPALFVETNIRTVYIHHFFSGRNRVTDKDIRDLLERTLDTEHPREFYYALMDYGSFLKKEVGNLSRSSTHYVKQAAFHGSRRQIRGAIIRQLTHGPQKTEDLKAAFDDPRISDVLRALADEQLISEENGTYRL